jgi:CRISPR system Cascade subunit CasD
MQSWGVKSRFDRRDTAMEPSKSGVVGLICSALGVPRTADLSDLSSLEMAVRVDQPGVLSVDYQTTEGVPPASGRGKLQTVQSRRWYLADAVFLVMLRGDDELVGAIAEAIERPRWLLALGRKSFPPTPPLVIGLVDQDIDAAIRNTPWLGRASSSREEVTLRVVRDARPDQAHVWRSDHPVSFEPRRFLRRPIRIEWVTLQRPLTERRHTWSST